MIAVDSHVKISDVWRHVKDVAGAESKHADLLDLLNGARREDTYQFPVPGVRACSSDTDSQLPV